MQRNWKIRICMFCWILSVSQHNNWIKGIPIVDPLTAAINFFHRYLQLWTGRIHGWGYPFFDVLWLNGRAGSLLFCMWTVRKPADIFDVTEINGASEPEALQLSIPLSSRLKNYTAQFRRGNIGFLRKKNLVGNFDIFCCMARNLLSARMALIRRPGRWDGNVLSENHRWWLAGSPGSYHIRWFSGNSEVSVVSEW